MKYLLLIMMCFCHQIYAQSSFTSAVAYNDYIVGLHTATLKSYVDYKSFCVRNDIPKLDAQKRKAYIDDLKRTIYALENIDFQGEVSFKRSVIQTLELKIKGFELSKDMSVLADSDEDADYLKYLAFMDTLDKKIILANQKFGNAQDSFIKANNLAYRDSQNDQLTNQLNIILKINNYSYSILIPCTRMQKMRNNFIAAIQSKNVQKSKEIRLLMIKTSKQYLDIFKNALIPFEKTDNSFREAGIAYLESVLNLAENELGKAIGYINTVSPTQDQVNRYNEYVEAINRVKNQGLWDSQDQFLKKYIK